jgi:ATP-binding protein involved in chromosome partitioning
MKDKILTALSKVIDPDFKKDLVTLGMIQDLRIEGKKVSFTIVLTTPACPLKNLFIRQCTDNIHQDVDPELQVEIKLDSKVTHQKKANAEKMAGVKNMIAVASGKGGVGKSTIAVNLAIALSEFGAKVGILDADINGPNLPLMLGIQDFKPFIRQDNGKNIIVPVEKFGLKIMSMGILVPPDQPLVWRGPMLSNALQQLMTETDWGELDYLLVDMPPGTGDIHITLFQQMPLTCAVLVTMPQKVSLSDTVRTMEMFRMSKVEVPVVGIIENMSWFTPAELPDNKYFLFGKGAGQEIALKYKVPLLGQLPLILGVAEQADSGKPAISLESNDLLKKEFRSIAEKVAQQVSLLNMKG